jgi:hypothetical protein
MMQPPETGAGHNVDICHIASFDDFLPSLIVSIFMPPNQAEGSVQIWLYVFRSLRNTVFKACRAPSVRHASL